jgi:acyl-CoA synthetase (AMP-forming)/AMP-acid ligase II/acyl carrier protein
MPRTWPRISRTPGCEARLLVAFSGGVDSGLPVGTARYQRKSALFDPLAPLSELLSARSAEPTESMPRPEESALSGLSEMYWETIARGRNREFLFVADGRRRTLGDLAAMADEFWTRAARTGVGRGEVVLLEFSRANWPHFIAAYLACHLHGAVPAVVSADGGDDRRATLPPEVGVRWHVRAHLKLDSWDGCEFSATQPSGVQIPDASTVEYLVTSGTSGHPTVVPVGLRARTANGRTAAGNGALRRSGVVALTAPPGTHAAQTVLAEALLSLAGGLACMDTWSPALFVELVEWSGASDAMLAPAMALSLLRSPAFDPDRLRGLRSFRLGMAEAPLFVMEELARGLPWAVITNIYTTTESWPAGTVMRYRKGAQRVVGRPLPGTLVRVVDERGEPARPGEVGRVRLAYVPKDSERSTDHAWVDTGDLGRLDAEGGLELLGRATDMVTRGGALVSVGAIEQAALESGLVDDAGAFGVADAGGGEILAAAVVWKGAEHAAELRSFIEGRLGKDATPTHFYGVPALPRDEQGKLRRTELERRYAESLAGRDHAPPSASIVDSLRQIWKEVLTRDAVGLNDDFFNDLGGDSLAAVICNMLIEERLGESLPLSRHHEARTLRKLAEAVEEMSTTRRP